MSNFKSDIPASSEPRTLLRFSTAGSVDDGKSTLIGRLLHDSKNIYEDQLEGLRNTKNSQEEFDLANLTDGLRAEREQGITIDVAYRYFSTPKRHFILADTPGHLQYTRNMATGASTSSLALLLIDAAKGITEQTKRHAVISALLGVPRMLVAVNKMDLVDWSEKIYQSCRQEFISFARKLGIREITFVPVSALKGDNVVHSSERTKWYGGPTVLSFLEEVYIESDHNLIDCRFPVQHVIRPNQHFRGFAGKVASGSFRVGDDVIVLPKRLTAKIKSIETFDGQLTSASPPQSVVLTLSKEIDVSRGDMIVREGNVPDIKSDIDALIIWMDENAVASKAKYYRILHGNRDVKCQIKAIRYRLGIEDLSREKASQLELNDVGRVNISCQSALYVDSYQKNRETGSFILVDDFSNATVAAGIIIDRKTSSSFPTLKDKDTKVASKKTLVFAEKDVISQQERATRLGHSALTIWFTGLSGSGKSTIGKELERVLFSRGVQSFRLDGDNLRNGLNKDLDFSDASRSENIRRVAEVARLFNQVGCVAICTLISPFESDRALARSIIGKERFLEVYLDTPLSVCEQRDTKGLYKKARAGEIKNFTGLDSVYEPPRKPDVSIATEEVSADESVRLLIEKISSKLWP